MESGDAEFVSHNIDREALKQMSEEDFVRAYQRAESFRKDSMDFAQARYMIGRTYDDLELVRQEAQRRGIYDIAKHYEMMRRKRLFWHYVVPVLISIVILAIVEIVLLFIFHI